MRAAQAAGLAALAVHEGDALEAASFILLDAHADGLARCDAGRFGQAREENLALVEAQELEPPGLYTSTKRPAPNKEIVAA